ncbi:MAG TPA: adenosylcobinamide-GDP ribazoletransferase [Woeseiaceae bacterium]|nr:adenosylcobinamide-GDP ribazoletransferase [Woeseiaceae bacterium]
MWQPLAVAIALLTRFPVAQYGSVDPRTLGRSVLWYPAVGFLIGLALAGVSLLMQASPAMIGAALALLIWCGMTGGLHLDGLSDTADALVGSHGDSARALEIMKDPSAGPMGVVAVCAVLIVKFAALTAHVSAETWWAIVAAPVLGRAAVIALLLNTPYIRPQGLGKILAANLPRGPGRLVLGATLAAAAFAGGIAYSIGAVLAFLLMRRLMMRTIGGTTGDTAGALVEVTEAAALVAAAL